MCLLNKFHVFFRAALHSLGKHFMGMKIICFYNSSLMRRGGLCLSAQVILLGKPSPLSGWMLLETKIWLNCVGKWIKIDTDSSSCFKSNIRQSINLSGMLRNVSRSCRFTHISQRSLISFVKMMNYVEAEGKQRTLISTKLISRNDVSKGKQIFLQDETSA